MKSRRRRRWKVCPPSKILSTLILMLPDEDEIFDEGGFSEEGPDDDDLEDDLEDDRAGFEDPDERL